MSSEDDMASHYGGDSHEDDDRSSEESGEEDEDPKATEKLGKVSKTSRGGGSLDFRGGTDHIQYF